MAEYALLFSQEAKSDLASLEKTQALQIIKKLQWVAGNAAKVRHEPLTGQWSGYYRWRIGDYRAIYSLESETLQLIIVAIGHRRDIYDA